MKTVGCYNCGSNENTFYLEDNGFVLVKCNTCGLLYVKDRPDDDKISESARHGRHEGVKDIDVTGHFKQWIIPRYLRVLEDLFKGDIISIKSWLDVGCGHGEFIMAVQEFSKRQINIRGTEPNIWKQESARKKGLNVEFFDLESHKEKYDVVSLLNVYSHLPDSPHFFKSLKKLINPNGELILETGNTAHLSAKDHVQPLNLPDHLSFASENIVINILKRLGFQIICVKKYPFLERNLQSYIREFIKLFLPKYKSRIRFFNLKKYSSTDMYIRAKLIA